jgi:hypothetical protein
MVFCVPNLSLCNFKCNPNSLIGDPKKQSSSNCNTCVSVGIVSPALFCRSVKLALILALALALALAPAPALALAWTRTRIWGC